MVEIRMAVLLQRWFIVFNMVFLSIIEIQNRTYYFYI